MLTVLPTPSAFCIMCNVKMSDIDINMQNNCITFSYLKYNDSVGLIVTEGTSIITGKKKNLACT